jgi:1-acyl-sn-glycerol-3-phosphate acyltransferase
MKAVHKMTADELAEAVRENEFVFDEYFQLEFAKSLEKNIFEDLNRHYYRPQFVGFGDIPQRNNPDRPLIYLCNHSGMSFPWDAMVMGAGILKWCDHDFKHAPRPLVSPMLLQSNLMNTFTVKNFWKKASGIPATALNFETMMHFNKSNILLYPEGVPGIGKGFNHKYELQQFSTSFVRMALKYQTDVIPILSVNSEYLNPWSYKIAAIDRLTRYIGVPFLPLSPILILLILQPWIFYFGFPVQMTFVMGNRISPTDIAGKPYEELTDADIRRVRDEIRASMQRDLNAAVVEHGKKPFDFWNLLRQNVQNISKFIFFSPFTWPALFWEHERHFAANNHQYTPMKVNFWSPFLFLLRNPFCLFFFIPIVGWIPILIWGYRGHTINPHGVSEPK